MKIAIISGSQRQNSNTLKVARHVDTLLTSLDARVETFLLNLEEAPLPLWDDSAWEATSPLTTIWEPIAKQLQSCHGFIVLSPEWSGMVPSALKNFFLYCSHRELGHKPALIVAVSSGMGGSYPVQELRISSYKNTRLCYIPEHVILRRVEDFLADYDRQESEITRTLKSRLVYSLKLLLQYGYALQGLRESGIINHKDFPNGM